MSCGISVPNSFVLPILEMERQSCSKAGSYALKEKFNLTAPALRCQSATNPYHLGLLCVRSCSPAVVEPLYNTASSGILVLYATFLNCFISLVILAASYAHPLVNIA